MSRTAWLIGLLACSSSTLASPPPPAPDAAACTVWQRELSFAQSVQQHDSTAFAGHIRADAVFDANSAKPLRGLPAIQEHWAPIIAGKTVHLSWYPQQVVVAGSGELAYSSGAYLFENPAPDAKPRYTLGKFATTWHRDSDGAWRVAFDGGDQGQPASAAEVRAFHAGRQPHCPAKAG